MRRQGAKQVKKGEEAGAGRAKEDRLGGRGQEEEEDENACGSFEVLRGRRAGSRREGRYVTSQVETSGDDLSTDM